MKNLVTVYVELRPAMLHPPIAQRYGLREGDILSPEKEIEVIRENIAYSMTLMKANQTKA